jgi:undecaprenyl phosphate N,N'-diacetylbacillosamine 1-phosphate transferase
MYHQYYKRLFDIFLSLVLIIFLSPLIILVFFLVWFTIGFPIFIQKRPGLNNKIFLLYKFKTLYDPSKKNLHETKRQNILGDFLRRTGIDELPQLFNILKNNMSFVGPRPLLIEYLKKYSKKEKKRHLVKPGITGLAQVDPDNFKKKNWKKSMSLDIHYVSNVSFLLDMKILYQTFKLIILKKKQYQDFNKFCE